MFWDTHPYVKFSGTRDAWTPERQWRLIGGIINNKKVIDSRTQEDVDVLTDELFYEYIQTWTMDHKEQIVENSTLPWNHALEVVLAELPSHYTVQALNIGTPGAQEWLLRVWQVWLAPRLCGADNVDCQTFGRGDCVFSDDPISKNRPWYNGDPAVAIDRVIGDEGGCACHSDFERGFWDSSSLCSVCKPGYGPHHYSTPTSSTSDWSSMYQAFIVQNGDVRLSDLGLTAFTVSTLLLLVAAGALFTHMSR